MVKKVMISQPMANKTETEIKNEREKTISKLINMGYEFVDSFVDENVITSATKQESVAYLAKSLEYMSLCDAVYFIKGWENARGCRIEHTVAKAYGLEILYDLKLKIRKENK
ncbi:MAG: DUF4406 domain-containing protein [Bacilli bacterium]|nr:DUF4406 domain-containing protein [Bacilli bacterium]